MKIEKTTVKKVISALGGLAALFIITNLSIFWKSAPLAGELFPQKYRIITPDFSDNLDFCGERVPIENFEVYERIEREFIANTYWHSATILLIKRANRWFPVIEPILKEYGIPEDIKYLAVAESNLTNAISPAGAVGFWQFMKSAADKYNLEVNSEIDERYHVEKSTVAACNYLTDAYEKYGTWSMAAASYNMGLNGVDRQIERQKTNNYYNLVLSEETSRYLARIISLKVIMQNPEKYGFDIDKEELYSPFQTYDVNINGKVGDFALFAKEHGINYKILKLYNPWLRENYLRNRSGKPYTVKIPVRGSIYVIPDHNL